MQKKNILFINGIPDNKKVKVHTILKDGRIGWETKGSANISSFIQNDLFNRSVVTFDTNPEQDVELNNIHAVFNEISDPDTHKNTLQKAENFYKSVAGKIPFFNIPSNIMKTTRDNIYQLLQDIDKLHVPKTVRSQPRSPSDIYDAIEKEGFDFPIIFRQAGDHGGISTLRVDDTTEEFYAFPLDGRDYYLTQFVDYIENGFYEKTRLIVIDGNIYIRGTMISDQWLVHAKNELFDTSSMIKRKNSLNSFENNLKPTIQPTITKIHKKLELDYFGIDCHIDQNNNILIFEINASMDVMTTSEKKKELLDPYIKKIKQGIFKMIRDKFQLETT
ncbi:ATP-grasp domain-containing protein [Sulfurovum riftiae]|uniref:ATP-grasp domain-containing protein n=1 Tax=Sulfurovum riftiae TaxID=1630136 RepID=A0A151CHP0_9BACT|nr:hypothetical protein [Sulfurovum riftiae]KYJ87048.1 hypothetical protein AS592_02360 [Sulfurovum riftiae]